MVCHQGPKYRERLHAIAILAFYYFRREPPPMGDSLYLSKGEHLYLVFRSSQLLYAILMCTLINHGTTHFLSHFPMLLSFVKWIMNFFYYIFRGNVSVAKLMFRMFTQFHNFMEVYCLSFSFLFFGALPLDFMQLVISIWFGCTFFRGGK